MDREARVSVGPRRNHDGKVALELSRFPESDWTVVGITAAYLLTAPSQPLADMPAPAAQRAGGCWKELPETLAKKKACFMWCVLAGHFTPRSRRCWWVWLQKLPAGLGAGPPAAAVKTCCPGRGRSRSSRVQARGRSSVTAASALGARGSSRGTARTALSPRRPQMRSDSSEVMAQICLSRINCFL